MCRYPERMQAPIRREEMKSSSEPSKSQKDIGAPSTCKTTPMQSRTIKDDLAIFINKALA
jgi:hypothetical protein